MKALSVKLAFRNLAIPNINYLSRIMSYYAVARGREVGIFDTWEKCEKQVKGFKGAKYKKFPNKEAAKTFINYVQNTGGPKNAQALLTEVNKCHRSPQKRKATADFFWPESKKDKASECAEISEEDLLRITLEAEKQQIHSATAATQVKPKSVKSSEYTSGTNVFKHRSKIWSPVGVQTIGGYEFKIDEEGFVICYTDGSCINNGKKGAHAGYGVYFADDHPLNAAEPVKGRATNNVGEIQAAIYAIKCAIRVGIAKLCVSTDSQFLINSVISWIPGWKKKNWHLKDGNPVKNVTEFKELDKLLQNNKLAVKWNYVKAHVGITGNEMADRFARTGANLYNVSKLKNINSYNV